MDSFRRRSNKVATAGSSARGSRLSPTISPKRPQSRDPILRADLFSLFPASREILNRHFDDAAAAREHFGADLVIELETARLEIELVQQSPRKQLQRGNRVREIAPGAHESVKAQASSAEIRRPRLL